MSDIPMSASILRGTSFAKKIRLILSAPFAFTAVGLLIIADAIAGD